MNVAAWIACWFVAGDCAQKALGVAPQEIFTESMAWLYWIPATAWLLIGFNFFCRAAFGVYRGDF